jgi:large subunit ribosomal protein L20
MRIKIGVARHRRTKRLLKEVKGYRGARHRRIKIAKETLRRAGVFAWRGRRLKKREYRRLWITRLSAATRAQGLSYSQLVHGLRQAGVEVNRKELSTLACTDAQAFERFVETAKAAL